VGALGLAHAKLAVHQDMVSVLQLHAASVELPWVSDGKPAQHPGLHPDTQVLSGLLQLVAGLVPPHRRWSPAHTRVVRDYLWSNGAHPFEPFGKSVHLSELLVDVARRNAVLVRLEAALSSARSAVAEVDAFAQKHLYDPFAADERHTAATRVWIDRLFHQVSNGGAPLAAQPGLSGLWLCLACHANSPHFEARLRMKP